MPAGNIAYVRYIYDLLNSVYFGPPLPFWAPAPLALPGLPVASYATDIDLSDVSW